MKCRLQALSVSALCGLTLPMYSLTSSMIWLCPSPEDCCLTPAALFQDVCDPVSFPDHISLSCSACLDLTFEYHSNAPLLKPWDDFLLATPEAHFTQPANQHFTFSCLVEHKPLLITIYPWSLSSTEPYMCSDKLRVITV